MVGCRWDHSTRWLRGVDVDIAGIDDVSSAILERNDR